MLRAVPQLAGQEWRACCDFYVTRETQSIESSHIEARATCLDGCGSYRAVIAVAAHGLRGEDGWHRKGAVAV